MSIEEIKEYLKRVDELGTKLTGKDKETYAWLIYGYNQCVKLLNETEEQCKKQKEVINKAIEYIKECISSPDEYEQFLSTYEANELLDILTEVE